MEEPTKYEVQREKINKEELTKLSQLFQKIGRQYGQFVSGDIVITVENRFHQVGSDLSEDKALELLETRYLKAFYPAESFIELQ